MKVEPNYTFSLSDKQTHTHTPPPPIRISIAHEADMQNREGWEQK